MAETRLNINNLKFSYTDKITIEDINISVQRGEFIGLIGPNGCGKSTALKNVYRALAPDSGDITLDGKNLFRMRSREAALKIAVVGQVVAIGCSVMNKRQKREVETIFEGMANYGTLDYVTAWYTKAAKYIKETNRVRLRICTTRRLCQLSYLVPIKKMTKKL